MRTRTDTGFGATSISWKHWQFYSGCIYLVSGQQDGNLCHNKDLEKLDSQGINLPLFIQQYAYLFYFGTWSKSHWRCLNPALATNQAGFFYSSLLFLLWSAAFSLFILLSSLKDPSRDNRRWSCQAGRPLAPHPQQRASQLTRHGFISANLASLLFSLAVTKGGEMRYRLTTFHQYLID